MTSCTKEDTKKPLVHFNNFYCYLPGGLYRNPKLGKKQKLSDDIDIIAAKLGINTGEIYDKMMRGHRLVMEVITLYKEADYPEELPEADKLEKEANILREEAHIEMIPLFEALLQLGYERNELMG